MPFSVWGYMMRVAAASKRSINNTDFQNLRSVYRRKTRENRTKNQGGVIEGIAIIASGEKFAIHLSNAQTDAIFNLSTAMSLYGDIMPTPDQGRIISAKWIDINNALQKFGGTQLSSSNPYYTTGTTLNTNSDIFSNCICGSGGALYSTRSTPVCERGY